MKPKTLDKNIRKVSNLIAECCGVAANERTRHYATTIYFMLDRSIRRDEARRIKNEENK